MTPPVYKFTGQLFLAFDDDGQIQWQGQIVESLQNGYFLCQLFGGFGQPTNCVARHLSKMNDWRFYDNEDEWRDAYHNASAAGSR